MKVILTQNVPNLGSAGEVKEVKNGYGFNYLLPEGLAELATPGAMKSIKYLVARAEKEQADRRAGITAALQAIDGKTITITLKAKEGKLFGAVTKARIVKALDGAVHASMIVLEQPIKSVGEYTVGVEHGSTKVNVKLSVVGE